MFKGEDHYKIISRFAKTAFALFALVALFWTGFVAWVAYKLLVHIGAL